MREALEMLMYARAVLITAYKRFETPILYVFRFFVGMFLFSSINGWFTDMGMPAARLDKLSSVLLAAVVTAVIPPTWVFMLMWVFITLHIFYFSLELAVIAGLALMCLIFFYIRIFPKESWLIVLLLVCFKLKIPYFVPLIAGLFVGASSIGAIIIGSMLWYVAPQLSSFSVQGSTLGEISVLSLPQTFGDTLKTFIALLSSNDEWIRVSLVFAIALLAVYFISRLPLPYSLDIGLGVGFFALVIGTFSIGLASGAFGFLASAFLSALLAYICRFFYIAVDYGRTERVTFQDDDYLYYVKAVPKVKQE